jgi:DNA-binding MarR family transcriptional regulator
MSISTASGARQSTAAQCPPTRRPPLLFNLFRATPKACVHLLDMSTTSHSYIDVLFGLSRVLAETSRRMDGRLGAFHGLSFVDLAVLTAVQKSAAGQIRRVDLAEHLGLTQSAVTRILIPLEKIGLVKRRRDPNDARVGFTSITATGRRVLEDARATAEELARDLLLTEDLKRIESTLEGLHLQSTKVTWRRLD